MKQFRQHLGWKLFFSYLTVLVVGIVSLAIAAQFHAPVALERHMAGMIQPMSGMDEMIVDLENQFIRAVNEILLFATGIALVASVLVSSFVTRRIVAPIQQMRGASRRIASGHYDERVQVLSADELGDLGQSFNQMAETLEQTEARRRQLIGDVAHELRTPLTSIRSVMEGLVDGVLPNRPDTFMGVQREVRRLQRLVHDLEELSKAEAGQLPMEYAPVEPTMFIQSAVERLEWQFEDKKISLTVDLPDNLPNVRVDAERMTQVILNLLGNALQYTPSGGQVRVSAEVTPTALQIHINDTGLGLSPEQLASIFERFYRVDKSRSRAGGGSGIGLTISKHIVAAHGGTLTAQSAGLGQGSTFTVVLPLP
ncbi:MAG TPA: HAMP domain-containing protein [Anaerolineae bacterium]|nr:HAMP domain-containing protein [Anaerolineae bacterium]